MANITDVDEFTSPVDMPDDTEPATSASLLQFAQDLANRTLYLKNRLEETQEYAAGEQAAHAVLVQPDLGAVLGSATAVRDIGGNDAGWTISWNDGEIAYPINHLLKHGVTISQIRARVDPGGTTATGADTMSLRLMRVAFHKTNLDTIVQTVWTATQAADSSGAAQVLTNTGTAEVVTEEDATYWFVYSIVVKGASTAGSSSDKVVGVEVTIANAAYVAP